jgi:hypothetical protein
MWIRLDEEIDLRSANQDVFIRPFQSIVILFSRSEYSKLFHSGSSRQELLADFRIGLLGRSNYISSLLRS